MRNLLAKLWKDESGVTAIEYGLIAGLVGALLIVVLGALGERLEGVFTALNDRLSEVQEDIAAGPPDTP